MKKILLILFVALIFSFNLASAYVWSDDGMVIFTLFNNSAIDTSKINISTSGSIASVSENSVRMLQFNEPQAIGTSTYTNVSTISFPDTDSLYDIKFEISNLVTVYENSVAETRIFLFGNFIESFLNKTSYGTINNQYNFRNYTAQKQDDDSFDLYIDGVFNRNIIPLNSNITIQQYARWNAPNGASVNTYWDKLFYHLLDDRVVLISPANETPLTAGFNVEYSALLSASTLTFTNATLFIYNSTNDLVNRTNISITGTSNVTDINVTLNTRGTYLWNYQACGTNSSGTGCIFADSNNTLILNSQQIVSESYKNVTTSGSYEFFQINITGYSGNIVTSAILHYNGSSYSATVTNPATNNFTISKSIVVPSVSTSINKTFYWTIQLNDGTTETTPIRNQTIQNLLIDNCTSNTLKLFNFTIRDEKYQNIINPSTHTTNAKIDLLIYNLYNGSLVQNFSSNYSKTNSFYVCLNAPITNGSEYKMDVLVEYSATNYSIEFYKIQKQLLHTSLLSQNISLYDLDTASATLFKINYRDANYQPVSDAIVSIYKYFIYEGVYKIVEQPFTDSDGNTLAHLEESNVIYNIVISKDNNILATFLNQRAKCQNPVLATCDLNLNSFTSSIQPRDFRVLDDVSYTFSFNYTSRIGTSLFVIPSGDSATISINATIFNYNNSVVELCSDYLYASTGTLSCTIPSTFNGTAVINLYKDGETIGQYLITIRDRPQDVYGGNLVFLLIFMYLTLIGLGLSDEPLVSVISILIGLVLGVAFTLIGGSTLIGAGSTGLYLIIALIIVMIKGSRR